MEGEDKFWRRLGVPIVTSLVSAICLHSYVPLLSILPVYACFTIGYGLPSTQPPDEGSALGRFWYKFFKQDYHKADVATRATIYLLMLMGNLPTILTWALMK